MPLLTPTLLLGLQGAFAAAMNDLLTTSASAGTSPNSPAAIAKASATFGTLASAAIDSYVRSGQVVSPNPPNAVIGIIT